LQGFGVSLPLLFFALFCNRLKADAEPVACFSARGFMLVYACYSRRSRGLSIGINLFPAEKVCTFNCPYCEVFPFKSEATFSLAKLEDELKKTLVEEGPTVRDISFSGSGEPTVSPHFLGAFKSAARIRQELAPQAELVVITNGTGLLNKATCDFLHEAAVSPVRAKIWLKLDAGTKEWYEAINCGKVPFDMLIRKIGEFTACSPVIIQTMYCALDGAPPPARELEAWEEAALKIAENSAKNKNPVYAFHIYGKSRPGSGDPRCGRLPVEDLELRAESLRARLAQCGLSTPVEIFP